VLYPDENNINLNFNVYVVALSYALYSNPAGNKEFSECGSRIDSLSDLSNFKFLHRLQKNSLKMCHIIETGSYNSLYQLNYWSFTELFLYAGVVYVILTDAYVGKRLASSKEVWARLLSSNALNFDIYRYLKCRNDEPEDVQARVEKLKEDEICVSNDEYVNGCLSIFTRMIFTRPEGRRFLSNIISIIENDLSVQGVSTPLDFDGWVRYFSDRYYKPSFETNHMFWWRKQVRETMFNVIRYNLWAPLLDYLPGGEAHSLKVHSIVLDHLNFTQMTKSPHVHSNSALPVHTLLTAGRTDPILNRLDELSPNKIPRTYENNTNQ
jgi:hypothetical protein